MALSFKLIRGFETSDLGRLSRALKHAINPAVELRGFQTELSGAARAREYEFGASSTDFRFAIDELLPMRIRGIERHLMLASVDPHAFADFLAHLLGLTTAAIASSEDIDEVAEALIAALDDLHGYVLAHSLVSEGYLEAELAHAERLLAGSDAQPDPADDDHEIAVASAEGNLALAA